MEKWTQAVYTVIQNSKTTFYYTHRAGNAVCPVLLFYFLIEHPGQEARALFASAECCDSAPGGILLGVREPRSPAFMEIRGTGDIGLRLSVTLDMDLHSICFFRDEQNAK